MARPEYITYSEINTILNLTGDDAYEDDDSTTLLINESSEYLEYVSAGQIIDLDLTADTYQVDNIKNGLAYQIQYFDNLVDDNDYESNTGARLGKYGENNRETSYSGEALKMSPKARRYWHNASMLYMGSA